MIMLRFAEWAIFIYFRTRKIPGTGSWRHKFPCLTHITWRKQAFWYEVQDLCHTAEYYVGIRNAGEQLFVCLISSSVKLIKLLIFMAHSCFWTETFNNQLPHIFWNNFIFVGISCWNANEWNDKLLEGAKMLGILFPKD